MGVRFYHTSSAVVVGGRYCVFKDISLGTAELNGAGMHGCNAIQGIAGAVGIRPCWVVCRGQHVV